MKQKEAALAPIGGGDRQLPLRFLFQDFLSASDDSLLFKAHPLESGSHVSQSSSAGRLLGVV
jgi:hypothetical protein